MKLKTVLLAGASLLALTSPAFAFVAIGSAVISTFLAVGLGGLLPVASAAAIGLATVGIAASIAQVALNVAMLGRRPSVDPNRIKTTTQGQEGPGRYAFGRVRLGGKLDFGNTAGYKIYRLLLHCFGPLDAVEEYFYGGLSLTVESDGTVSSPPWVTKTSSYLNIKTKVGNGTETAWSDLETDFSELWTDDHKVQGIAQSLLRALNPGTGSSRFLKLYQGGIKELELKARVGLFYDPREESHNIDDPGTWEWSMNGVLHCLHWFRQLPGITDAIIDFDAIGTVATEAEVNVDTLDGTAPRCQLSGGWEGPLTYDIVLDMLQSAGLEVRTTAEGKYTFAFIEDDPDSELTLYDRHIIDREIYTGDEAAKRANICTLKFFSPERQYEIAEIDLTGASWAKVQDEIDIYGEQEDPITLTFCTDASQAQRIARRLFHMRRSDKMVLRTTFAGIAAWGKNTITVEIPDVGEDGESIFVKCRKEGGIRINDAEGTCEIALTIIPDILKTAWAPETDEVAAPPLLEDFQFESELDTPGAPSAAIVVQYRDDTYETRVAFAGVSGGSTAEANYRTYDANDLPQQWSGMSEINLPGSSWLGYAASDLRGGKIDFRCRFFNSADEASYFSPVLSSSGLAIDNSVPAAPTSVTATQHTTDGQTPQPDGWEVTVDGAALNAVTVEIQDGAANRWLLDFRPGEQAILSQSSPATMPSGLKARLLSSNDTPSAWVDA